MTRKLDAPRPSLDAGLQQVAALRDAGRLREAAILCERLVQSNPDSKVLLNQFGAILLEREDWRRAVQRLRQSLRLDPRQPLVQARLGKALLELGQPEKALAAHLRALDLHPDLIDAQIGRVRALSNLDRVDEAMAAAEEVLNRHPDAPEAHHQRARLLRKTGKFEEAKAEFDATLRLKPGFLPALVLRSLLLAEFRDVDGAIASARQAVADASSGDNPRAVLSEVLLLAGRYAEAWEFNESRRNLGANRRPNPEFDRIPQWDCRSSIEGKSLMIQPEIGLGDYVMFSRFVPMLRERGCTPVLVAPKPLASLLGSLGGSPVIIPRGSPLPPVDLRCPVMSLPRAFGTTLETIPLNFPYLHVHPAKAADWAARLGNRDRPRVGLVWSGKEGRGIDQIVQRRRTVDPRLLAPLVSLPLEFHSLQKEYPDAGREWLDQHPQVRDHSPELADFSDTAALACQMDLVVSIDTSVAHVVGALALPLWVMLPYSSDFRWDPQRPTSPWYPSARLFRQTAPGVWEPVVEQVRTALIERFGLHGHT